MTEIFIDILEGSNNTITVTENDNLTETYKLILMKNRIRINLTDKKVKFVFVKSNSNRGDIFDEMNISNPAEGEVELPITNKITKDNGLYSCGLAIYNNEGYLEHTGIFNLYVKENLFEKVSDELIEHNTYKKLTSLLDKASDINNKLITNTSEANKVNNAAINLKNALEGEVNKANQVNDTLTKTNSAAVDKNKTLNNSLEEAKKLLTAVDKYNLDNYMRKVDIPSDRDCNSFKEINVFCVFDTGAGDFKNTPEGTLLQGSCRVFLLINRGYSDGRFQQEFINVYPQDRVTRYVRNFNADGNGIWGNWYKVYDEANKPTPNDIGAVNKNGDKITGTLYFNCSGNEIEIKNPLTNDQARGMVFRSQSNGLIGMVGSLMDQNNVKKMFIGNTDSPWTGAKSLTVDTSGAYFNNQKIYHAGNKPSPADIGASPSDHNHDNRYFTRYAPRIKGVDINTYSTGGFYSIVHHEQPCTNLPLPTDGYLLVVPWSSGEWCSQIFINDNEGDTYIRTKTGSEVNQWTSWGKIYDSNHKPTAQDIGAVPFSNNSAMTIHADADGSSEEEYLSLKAGKNDLRILSSATNQSSTALIFNGNQIYHTDNKPTPAEIGAVANSSVSTGVDANFVVKRDSAGDINARLLRSSYQDDNYINGAIAFRTNNKDDNYTRYCNNPTAVREWIGARPSNWNPTWNDVQDKPSSFPPSGHNHDDLYFRKGNWNTNGGQDLLVHGKRALVGTPEGNLYLGYGGDFTALYFGNNYKVYHTNNKPTPADIGAAPNDHNHDRRYLPLVNGSTNESYKLQKKFIEVGADDTKIVELGVGPTDTYIHNTKSNKYLALKDDGRLFYNNKEVCDRGHFTGDPGLNGYQMFPSGLLVQWGYVDMGKDTTKLVNFPKSFKDNNYNLQVSVYGGPGRVPAVKTYYAKNNNFYIQCEAGFCVYWEAKGSV
ncbi:BppU family phage baseplate upper protein [Clostridium baratii]|uniref:BppU family phage baseplate upper protein n=1 Tax=Clostridium baratii TaxID=1561 RepID=UPI0030CF0C5C